MWLLSHLLATTVRYEIAKLPNLALDSRTIFQFPKVRYHFSFWQANKCVFSALELWLPRKVQLNPKREGLMF